MGTPKAGIQNNSGAGSPLVRGRTEGCDALAQYLLASYDLPFVWGERDCALWACDWIKQRRGVDPGAPYRGRYTTQLGCARVLARNGGLLQLATDAFRASGL